MVLGEESGEGNGYMGTYGWNFLLLPLTKRIEHEKYFLGRMASME